jgi:hypothetical protein
VEKFSSREDEMQKFYIGDDANNEVADHEKPNFQKTINNISKFVTDGGVYADFVDKRTHVIVKVHAHTGTGEYLARGSETLTWLTFNSFKKQNRGSVTDYYIKYDVR